MPNDLDCIAASLMKKSSGASLLSRHCLSHDRTTPTIYNDATRWIDIPMGILQMIYYGRHATQYPITVSRGT
ncbi:hypothetical protein V1289_005809 [Bradyrhizobium sp. AZCC 2289]